MRNHMKIGMSIVVLLMLVGIVVADDENGFVDTFNVKPQDFASVGRNDYCILEPGDQSTFEGEEDGKPGRLIITVLNETKKIDGVETRIIEEREWSGQQLIEVSRNYFAIDKATNDIYYFGEDVETYKNGKVNGHAGSWHAGENGAHYGMFMPAMPKVGAKFYQELAPKVAMDRFEVVSTTEKKKVPAGDFENVLKTKETSPLEPDSTEYKLYAPRVGLIKDGALEIVKHEGAVKP